MRVKRKVLDFLGTFDAQNWKPKSQLWTASLFLWNNSWWQRLMDAKKEM